MFHTLCWTPRFPFPNDSTEGRNAPHTLIFRAPAAEKTLGLGCQVTPLTTRTTSSCFSASSAGPTPTDSLAWPSTNEQARHKGRP